MELRKLDLKVEDVPLDEIKPYEGNAKEHTQEQLEAVEASIKEFGFANPVLLWHNQDGYSEIIAGHARCKAAKSLCMDTVPAIYLDALSDAQRRALTLADNQTTMMTGWDMEQLSLELDALALDFDMADFGFDIEIAADDLASIDEIPLPEETEPRCKEGDLWILGDHRLVCGDATDPSVVARATGGGGHANLLVTDPPYNVDYEGKTEDCLKIQNDFMQDSEFEQFLYDAFSAASASMKPGAAFYVWHASSTVEAFLAALRKAGLSVRQQLIWAKNTFVLGRQDYQWQHEPCLYGWKEGAAHYFVKDRTLSTLIQEDKPLRSAQHPTMKPIQLIASLIANSSKKGDLVLDTFGGSGSTLLACEQLGRRCAMVELDPKYCDVIIALWEEMTGERAEVDRV